MRVPDAKRNEARCHQDETVGGVWWSVERGLSRSVASGGGLLCMNPTIAIHGHGDHSAYHDSRNTLPPRETGLDVEGVL